METRLPGAPNASNTSRWRLPSTTTGVGLGRGAMPFSKPVQVMQAQMIALAQSINKHGDFKAYLSKYIPQVNLDAIGAVGGAKGADGLWGNRTDKGLQAVQALLDGLNKLRGQMHLAIEPFPTDEFEQMPKDRHKVENVATTADNFATQIAGAKRYFDIAANIMTTRYADQMKQDAELIRYHDTKLNDEQQRFTEQDQRNQHPIPGLSLGGSDIKFDDIASVDAFTRFLQQAKMYHNDGDVSKYAKQLRDQLQAQFHKQRGAQ